MCLREQHREHPRSGAVSVEGGRGSWEAFAVKSSFGDICHPVQYLPGPHPWWHQLRAHQGQLTAPMLLFIQK